MEEEEKKINKIFAILQQASKPRQAVLRGVFSELDKPISSPYFFVDLAKRRSFLSFSVMMVGVVLLMIWGGSLGENHDPFANSQTVHAQIIREVDRVIETGFAGELEILAAEDALAAEVGVDDFLNDLSDLENELLP